MRGLLNEADRHDHGPAGGRKSSETLSGSHQRSGRLTDYYPLIFQAISRLESNTAETRGNIYDRARTAMLLRLRSIIPSLTESDVGHEQLALEAAIKKVETESLHHLGAPTQLSIRRHRPSRPVKDIFEIRAASDAGTRSTAAVQDEDRAGDDPNFARKPVLSKSDLSVELRHLSESNSPSRPCSSVVRKLVPIPIIALLVFAAPGAY
jgi:hypothetical protein